MSDADEPTFRSAEPQADSLELTSLPPLGEDQFSEALAVLLTRVESLPAEERLRLKGAADATRQKHEQLRQTVQRLQETLDTLRLSIKYLVFDVEATRRENDYLKKLLGRDEAE
jgi:hypothetical protein